MEAKLKTNKDRKQCNNCQHTIKQVAPCTSTTNATSKPQAVDRVWQETPKTGHNTLLTATPRTILPNPATGEMNITIVINNLSLIHI